MEDKDSPQISQQEVDVWYIQEKRTGGEVMSSVNHQKPVILNTDECNTGSPSTLPIKEPRSSFNS